MTISAAGVAFEVRRCNVRPGCFLTRYPARSALNKEPVTIWIPREAQQGLAELIRQGGMQPEYALETGEQEEPTE